MNRFTLIVIGLLTILSNCTGARGQGCALSLQAHFSVYNSVARDGEKIHTTVTTQGYASVMPSAGCPMGSATHKVAADNTISNTGGWNYSAPGCASCYFSVTNSQEIVGVPGVVYPWGWTGEAICSIAGGFWGGGGGSINIPGCVVPSTEATADKGFSGAAFRELFDMTLSDSVGDNFNGQYLQEATTQPGTNACWWPGSGLAQSPGVSGGSWTIGTVGGKAEANHWGYDAIGWDNSALATIQTYGPANGVKFPCVTTIYQSMEIMCNANTSWTYTSDVITITVDATGQTMCRAGVCGQPAP